MPFRYRREGVHPPKDPLTAIPPSRHPFQFWVLFALTVSGLSNFLTPGSEVLRQGLDPLQHKTWALTLLAGSALALASAWWPDRITGLLLERLALITVGLSCPVYALVVFAQSGSPALIAISLTASVGIAALWRAKHVTDELRVLRTFVLQHELGFEYRKTVEEKNIPGEAGGDGEQ